MKILIVEDEPLIAETVAAYLQQQNYTVVVAGTGSLALRLFEQSQFDLVVLDLMLPELSGEEVCRAIRKKSRIPIIVLSAKASVQSRIDGLALGADDYMTKPFSPRELVARIQSVIRRVQTEAPLFQLMSWNDDLKIDMTTHEVWKQNQAIHLTPNEFRMLALFVTYPQKIFSREAIIEAIFPFDFDGNNRIIDSHIKNMRSKIETDSGTPIYIITVRGIGYRFGGEQK